MSRKDCLAEFLALMGRLPFRWGERDCALWCCDWIRIVRGTDPAAVLRGTYADAEGCAALLEREGGLAALAARLFAASGLSVADEAETGDVGLVATTAGDALMIACDGRWAWKSDAGVALMPVAASRLRMVWRV